MQINKLLWLVVPAVLSGGTGCVYTHHPAAYSAVTTDAAVGTPTTVVATSPRPAVRVYAEPSSKMSITTPVPPPVTTTVVPGHIVATSNPADVAITSSIRQMLEADTARIYRNVDFAIDNATVRSEERRVGKECRSRWS